jgi:two-component system KDP operon response regulator KdpE
MNKTLILVVEDDRPIRNLIVTTLKTHDYKYLAAENGNGSGNGVKWAHGKLF